MDLDDFKSNANRRGRGASRSLGGKIIHKVVARRTWTPRKVAWAFRLRVATRYDWAKDAVEVLFIDWMTGQMLYAMTDPYDPEQIEALAFAIDLTYEGP